MGGYRVCIRIMEKKMETTIRVSGLGTRKQLASLVRGKRKHVPLLKTLG